MAKSRVRRASKKKPLNLPSFLPGMRGSAKWHVREVGENETPHTLNRLGGEAEMAIPTGDSTEDQFVKLHELLHAAHSPVEEPRDIVGPDKQIIQSRYLMIAEEMRINLVGRTYVGHTNLPDLEESLYQHARKLAVAAINGEGSEALLAYIDWCLVAWTVQLQTLTMNSRIVRKISANFYSEPLTTPLPTHSEMEILRLPDELLLGINTSVWTDPLEALFTDGTVPSWDEVIQLALFLQETYQEIQRVLDNSKSSTGAGQPMPGGEGDEDPDLSQFQKMHGIGGNKKENPSQLRQRLREQMLKKEGGNPDGQVGGDPVWGKMTTRIAKMTKKLPKKLISKMKYRATDEGAVPRYIHRMPVDGKIFGRKKRTPGGSVLIDDSGSMSWSTADISAILHAAPAVNIGAYSGYSRKEGELVIIAKDGSHADVDHDRDARPKGSDNLVDLPALEWLATMPKPRIWVSDTYITISSGDTHVAAEQVFRLCKQKDINIVANAEQAQEVFEGKREIYR